MAKSFYKLRDTGTTFYDISQARGVVADRIAPLENTGTVVRAERDGVLIKLDKSDGAPLYKAQQMKLNEAGDSDDPVEDKEPTQEGLVDDKLPAKVANKK